MMLFCDVVIAIARHYRETINELYGIPSCKIELITNSLDIPWEMMNEGRKESLRTRYGFRKDEKLIIFAGRLDSVKGIHELIEAFKMLQETRPDAGLIIAGDGNLKKCFESVGPYWSKVTFTGFVSKKRLYDLYAVTDLGVVPSLHEEFGYVALEMIRSGLTVLVNYTKGLKELADCFSHVLTVDFGTYVFGDRVRMLKDKIEEYMNDRCSTRPMNHGVHKDEYAFHSFSRQMKLLYQRL